MGMIEILLNENLNDGQQLVIDSGQLSVPQVSSRSSSDYGPLNIGTGADFLLVTYDRFSTIFGYTICGYAELVPEIGSIYCNSLPQGHYSLDPFSRDTFQCGSNVVNANKKSKLEFLCDMYQ
jgi:hypothetical protein